MIILSFGVLALFLVSLIQRRSSVREQLAKTPKLLRLVLFVILFFIIVYWGIPMSTKTGGFLYAQF